MGSTLCVTSSRSPKNTWKMKVTSELLQVILTKSSHKNPVARVATMRCMVIFLVGDLLLALKRTLPFRNVPTNATDFHIAFLSNTATPNTNANSTSKRNRPLENIKIMYFVAKNKKSNIENWHFMGFLVC